MSQTHIKTFSSWTELAAVHNIKNGSLVNIILNNEILLFKYDSSSAAVVNSTANGPGTVANGQGGVGRWLLQYRGSIKPEWFGAVADGSTDDSTAIQAAIDAAGSGDIVYLSSNKIYNIESTLIINSGIVLLGGGRGTENAPLTGAVLRWAGADDTAMIQVNDGGASSAVHGWTLSNFTVNGGATSGSIGIVVGPAAGSFMGTSGVLKELYVTNCERGIVCKNAQLGSWDQVHVNACQGDGVVFEHALPSGGNTSQAIKSLRCSRNGGVGVRIEHLTTTVFDNLYTELNDEEGVYVDSKYGDSRIYVRFEGFSAENNNLGGGRTGTGVSTFKTVASTTTAPIEDLNRPKLFLNYPRIRTTDDLDYEFDLSGAVVHINWPEFEEGGLIRQSSFNDTNVHIKTAYDPKGARPWSFQAQGTTPKTVLATCEFVDDADSMANNNFIATSPSGGWRRATRSKLGVLELSDYDVDLQTKNARIVVPLYDTSQDESLLISATNLNLENRVSIGGGSSIYNTAERVSVYSAADHTTKTGTEIHRTTINGVDFFGHSLDNIGAANTSQTTMASAATTNIGSADANYINITGTTTINSFNTIAAGIIRILKFDGVLTITHNGTSMILPGNSSITTAAGDIATFVSEGSGNWRCTNYTRAANSPDFNAEDLGATGTDDDTTVLRGDNTWSLKSTQKASLLAVSGTTTVDWTDGTSFKELNLSGNTSIGIAYGNAGVPPAGEVLIGYLKVNFNGFTPTFDGSWDSAPSVDDGVPVTIIIQAP